MRRALSRPGKATVLLIAVLLLGGVLTLAALHGSYSESLPVSVRVVSVRDDSQVGAITSAVVRLTNHGARTVSPRFALMWKPQPARWRNISGPALLEPGATATYNIVTEDGATSPPLGQSFQVKVNDSGSIVSALSRTVHTEKGTYVLTNPRLVLWSKNDMLLTPQYTVNLAGPFGWTQWVRMGPDDQVAIDPVSISGAQAVRFSAVQGGKSDPGGWAYGGLSQQIDFPSVPLAVTTESRADFKMLPGGWPLTAFGVEVSDGVGHVAWLLFQQTGSGDLDYDLPTGQHIHVYDVSPGRWVTTTVDLRQMYSRLGWSLPKKLNLNLFVGASDRQRTSIEGYIAEIGAAPSARP